MHETIFSVFDIKKKIVYKQFKTKGYQHSWDYDAKDRQAHRLQANLCKLFGVKHDGLRIGVHINIFNDIPAEKVMY